MEQPGSAAQQTENVLTRVLDGGALAVPARTIPLPDTISKEAWALLSQKRTFFVGEFEDKKAHTDDEHAAVAAESAAIYPVSIDRDEIGGVPCVIVEPKQEMTAENRRRVLLNLTAGGAFAGPSSQVEAIPIANLMNLRVVRPIVRKPPQHPYPADLEDAVAVYRELLKNHESRHIGVYGACTGGILSFQLVSKLVFQELPVPAAVVVWASGGERTRITDSIRINHDIDSSTRDRPPREVIRTSINGVDAKDPIFSPIYSNLRLFPPSLLMVGTRDPALSSAGLMHRALLRAGTPAELVIFEAMEHGFSYYPSLPEARELYDLTARFMKRYLMCEVM